MKNLLRSGRAARLLWLTLGLAATLTLARAAPGPELGIDAVSFDLVGSTRVTRTLFDFTYRADVANTGGAAEDVVAMLASTSPATTVIDGELHFGDVPASTSVTSIDTFTIRQDRTVPFDPSALHWTFSFAQPANTPPVADAGADQTVFTGSPVTLNGGGSSDADGDTLTFSWSIAAAPPGSSAALDDNTAVAPAFVADVAGIFEIDLVVHDGETDSVPDRVRVTTIPLNTDPVADAGADRQVFVGDTVQLDGSGSTDVDGDDLDFSWAFVSVPAGSTVGLSGADTVQPTFVPDLPGTYVVRLAVDDGNGGTDADEVAITTELANRAPVADAGPDQAVEAGQTVLLDGAGSSDPDGDVLTTYAWSFVSRPAGSTAVLTSPNAQQTGFLADRPGIFVVQLIVSDGTADSTPDTVMVTTTNTPPVSDAGLDQEVTAGETVQLDGSGSSDANGDPLSWFWSFTSRPAGSSADFSDPLAPNPTFEADEAGLFVAQLIVNDGTVDSAPDTVTITAGALPTLSIDDISIDEGDSATATAAFTVTISAAPDDEVTVDFSTADDTASAGSDYAAATGTLTFPAGSAAPQTIEITVNGDTDVEPDETFFVDLASPVNATLADEQGTGTIVNDDAQPSITLAPASVTVLTGDSETLTLTLGEPAGAAGQAVALATDGSIVSVPPEVNVAPGATSAQFDVTAGQIDGTAVITASAAGFTSGTANVTVSNRGLTVTLASPLVGVGRTIDGSVTLADPAPAGGVSVALASGNAALATVTPSAVTIAAGDVSAAFTVDGVGAGATTIDAGATGFEPDSAPIEVTGNLISIGTVPVIGPGQSASLPISLSSPAAGDVVVNLTSADSGIATVTASIVIPDGQQIPAANAQVTGIDLGTTQVTAAADGFAPDTRDVTVAVTLSFAPDSLTLNQEATGILTLSASAPAPAGGFTLDLASDDPTIASVPASALIPAGQSSVQVTVTAEAEGSTFIRASGAQIDEVSASVSVNPPQFVLISSGTSPIRVGENLQDSRLVRLESAPPAPVTLTLSVPAGSGVLLNTSRNGAGSRTITFPGVTSTGNQTFWVQGLAAGASTTLTASAPGYADATVTVAVDPSGFVISSPSVDFTTDAFAGNTLIRVNPVRLTAGTLAFGGFQAVRGGFSVQVPVTSSNAGVGAITTSPLTFADGAPINSVVTEFDPLTAGTTTLAVTQPAGFDGIANPTSGARTELEATVTSSAVLINTGTGPIRVGENLQDLRFVRLESVPPAPVTLTLSVPVGSGVLLHTSQNGAGSPTISFPGVDDIGTRTFWVQGLTEGASTTLTASAPGYADDTVTVAVDPSGFVISTPSIDFTTDAFATNTLIRVNPVRLNAGALTFAEFQTVRGGFSVQVPVTSSNPGVGAITTSPLTFADGASLNSVSTEFDPLTAGITTLAVTQPAGFDVIATPFAGAHTDVEATVTSSAVLINTGTSPIRVGENLQDSRLVRLESAPPAPVTVTLSVPANSGVLLNTSQNGTGSPTISFPGVTSTANQTFWVQGLTEGISTTLTASAPGYADTTVTVAVDPSGFVISTPSVDFTTDAFAANTVIRVNPVRLNAGTLTFAEFQTVRGGFSVQVPVTSSNAGVGAITTSPLTFADGVSLNSVSTEFDPLTAGATTLALTQPAGFDVIANPFAGAHTDVEATVEQSAVLINNSQNPATVRVGENLQQFRSVRLESAPPSPVTLTLSVPAGSGVLLNTSQNGAGSPTISFPGVDDAGNRTFWVQGLTEGASTTLTASAPGYADATVTVAVDPSGFVISTPSADFTTTAGAANRTVLVNPIRLNAGTLTFAEFQSVSGGFSVQVPVTSSDESVGVITTSPLTFADGANLNSVGTAFQPLAAGSSTISVTQPAGFDAIALPAAGAHSQLTATVTP